MKLGRMPGDPGAELSISIARIQLAERPGCDPVWTAEAYGSDAIPPLAWIEGSLPGPPRRVRQRCRA